MGTRFYVFLLFFIGFQASSLHCREERLFKEGKYGKSFLKYSGSVPVLYLKGSPAEIGKAEGYLLKEQIKALHSSFLKKAVKRTAMFLGRDPEVVQKLVLEKVGKARASIPKPFMEELAGISSATGLPLSDVVLANLLPEILPRVFCTTFFISKERMEDKAPLFGRNLDYPPVGGIERYGLVIVYSGKGKKAVASFTFPGLIGVVTGMNRDGLCGATMDVISGARKINTGSIPRFMFYRLLLSECTLVEEVKEKIKGRKCLSGGNFMVVDAKGNAMVLESPGDMWVIRYPSNHMLYSTNHFHSSKLKGPKKCRRYSYLENKDRKIKVFSLKNAFQLLRGTAQTIINVQAMIFRPETRDVYFAFGRVPACFGKFHLVTGKTLFSAIGF